MYIIGVDCAVSDEKTGISLLRIQDSEVRLLQVRKGTKTKSTFVILDEWISELTMDNEKILICLDAPLGWPICFGEKLFTHSAGESLDCPPDSFFRRRTDNIVHELLGKRPLDVTANFIARTAFHALYVVGLLQNKFEMKLLWDREQLQHTGFIEVYPAAWQLSEGINQQNYKKDAEVRRVVVENLKTRVLIGAGEQEELISSEHLLDSFLCCLCGLDFIDGKCITPAQMQVEHSIVQKEGWIWFKIPAD